MAEKLDRADPALGGVDLFRPEWASYYERAAQVSFRGRNRCASNARPTRVERAGHPLQGGRWLRR
jgi:hypothetical protein